VSVQVVRIRESESSSNALDFRRCLGLAMPPTPEIAHLLAFTYPQAFLDAFARISTDEDLLGFKFVSLSGALVEKDQSRSLWFLDQERKVRVSPSDRSDKVTKRYPRLSRLVMVTLRRARTSSGFSPIPFPTHSSRPWSFGRVWSLLRP
jgi:hypothetical protein